MSITSAPNKSVISFAFFTALSKTWKVIACACAFLAPCGLNRLEGQVSENGKPFTLSECIARALEMSPSLKVAQLDLKAASARLDKARSGLKPRIEVTSINGIVPEARGDAVHSDDDITDTDGLGPFTRLDVNLVQPLYTFGRLSSYIDAAIHGLEAQKAGLAKTEADVVRDVKRIYYSLVLNRELESLLSDTRKNFKEALDRLQEIIEEGEERTSLVDLVKLKVAIADLSANLAKVKQARELGIAALKRELGLSNDVHFEISDKDLKPQPVRLRSLEDYIARLFRERPEWRQLEEGLKAQEAKVKAEKRRFFPVVFLALPFRYAIAPNRDDQDNPFVRDDFNYIEGGPAIGIRWEFSWGLKADLAEARAEWRKLLAQRNEASSGLSLEVRKAFAAVIEAQERLEEVGGAYRSARGLVTTMAGAKGLGVQDLKEMFEAYGLYTKAGSDRLLAIYQYNIALAELSRAVGTEVTDLRY